MALVNERIKKCRQDRGMTLLEVAEKLGVKEATMQRYESGAIKNIKHEIIVLLAEIFNCSPSYLMGWVSDPDGNSADEAKLDQQLSGIDYALSGELHDLTDAEKQDILDYIRFKKEQKKTK